LFIQQIKNSARTNILSVLFHGPQGSGKTSLAATLALSSQLPFVKLISPEQLVGLSETAKMNAIAKVRRIKLCHTRFLQILINQHTV
jgi:vesicle-fusing ATPase